MCACIEEESYYCICEECGKDFHTSEPEPCCRKCQSEADAAWEAHTEREYAAWLADPSTEPMAVDGEFIPL